jgi:16S rRNA (guanine966-N2)-methyltransferase
VKPGVRVTGGSFRGRGLTVPPGARPTEGRVREALFSIWGDRLDRARVLDLFSGSGVVGLEALSRGALAVLFVDDSLRAVKTLQENAAQLGEKIEIRKLSLPTGLARLSGPYDLVFADPPYGFGDYESLLAGIAPLLAADGEIAVEHATRKEVPIEIGPLVRTDVRRYGDSSLSFYRVG